MKIERGNFIPENNTSSSELKKKALSLARTAIAATSLTAFPAFGLAAEMPQNDASLSSINTSSSHTLIYKSEILSQKAMKDSITIASPETTIPTDNNSSAENTHDIFIHSDTAKLLATLASLYAVTSSAQGYFLSKKYDGKAQERIRNTASGALVATTGLLTAEAYSMIDVNPTLPATLFLGYTILQAGSNLRSTYEREANPKIRAAAMANSALLISLGAVTFIAAHKLS